MLLIQIENESGNIGSMRDNSAEANRAFAGAVPSDLLAIAHKQPGTWSQVFAADASEVFQLYHQAKYINEIAAAGKAEFPIPYYINVWIDYPAAELPQRQMDMPGIGYPSGGAVQKWVGLWRALAPSIDMIGPDICADDSAFYRETMRAYHRVDNPLWIPEPAAATALASFSSMPWGKELSAFPLSVWTNQAGTSWGTSHGRRTRATSLWLRP